MFAATEQCFYAFRRLTSFQIIFRNCETILFYMCFCQRRVLWIVFYNDFEHTENDKTNNPSHTSGMFDFDVLCFAQVLDMCGKLVSHQTTQITSV